MEPEIIGEQPNKNRHPLSTKRQTKSTYNLNCIKQVWNWYKNQTTNWVLTRFKQKKIRPKQQLRMDSKKIRACWNKIYKPRHTTRPIYLSPPTNIITRNWYCLLLSLDKLYLKRHTRGIMQLTTQILNQYVIRIKYTATYHFHPCFYFACLRSWGSLTI